MVVPVVELMGVEKSYWMGGIEVKALRGINLKINQGEFVAVTGPSGSGKSTLMHIIGCLDAPTRGKLFLDGEDVSGLGESELAAIRGKKMGFVFQAFNLVPALSALDNVQLPLVFQGVPAAKRLETARKLLEEMGLEKRMGHRPSELSGGEQQRVAIARALVTDPQVILADEPTGNLDTRTGDNIMRVISELHDERNKTIVIVTHEIVVAKFAERIIRVRDGVVVEDRADHETRRVVS